MSLREDTIKVGDIRKALKLARDLKGKEAKAEFSKKAATLGVKTVLGMIPALGAVSNILDKGLDVKDLYDAAKSASPKEKKANQLWDFITIDPESSAILDDKVESDFIDALSQKVSVLDDEDELPDADTQLASYLKGKYSGAHVTKKD